MMIELVRQLARVPVIAGEILKVEVVIRKRRRKIVTGAEIFSGQEFFGRISRSMRVSFKKITIRTSVSRSSSVPNFSAQAFPS